MEYLKSKVARRLLIGALLVLGALTFWAFPSPILAAGAITVSVDAPAVVTVGDDFVVRVDIANVTDLDAFVFRVRFDPGILDLPTTDTDKNGIFDSIFSGVVGGKTVRILSTVWKEPGLISIVGEVQPFLSGATGNGYLAELHFHALSPGTSNIGLEQHSLSNIAAQSLSAVWNDASVTTSLIAVWVDSPAAATVGDDFIVRVSIANVKDLDAFVFRVRFDPGILDLPTTDADNNSIYDSIVDGVVGGTRVQILSTALKEPGLIGIVGEVVPFLSGTSGSGYLAELHFHALSAGASNIRLEQHSLSNIAAESLLAVWKDGPVITVAPAPAPTPTPGGGGGGGVAPTVPAGTTDVSGVVTSEGRFTTTVTATSEDKLVTITIATGTVGLTKELKPLTKITMTIMDKPPSPPEHAHLIGLAYDFGPDGATFEPPITVKYAYSPSDIPEGIAEGDLVIAYYDESAGKWVELPSTVDPVTHTISGKTSHFTTFAVIGKPKPAAFSLGLLVVSPTEVAPGQEVNVSVTVANTGGLEGSYSVVLKINDVKETEKSVTLAAGKSQTVSFTVTRKEAGTYSVAVDGLSGSFTVVAPPSRAAFSVSNLVIQPAEVNPKEPVLITVLVANTGGTRGSYSVVLNINGVKEAEKSITPGAGESQEVSFTVTREEAGTYSVAVDGLSGSFTVVAPPKKEEVIPPKKEEVVPAKKEVVVPPAKVNWPLIGGGIGAAVLVAALLVFFLVVRRKKRESE